jgi:hypothetical protein
MSAATRLRVASIARPELIDDSTYRPPPVSIVGRGRGGAAAGALLDDLIEEVTAERPLRGGPRRLVGQPIRDELSW